MISSQLFGPEDETEGAELDEALKNGESGESCRQRTMITDTSIIGRGCMCFDTPEFFPSLVKELENLRIEAKQMKAIRTGLESSESVEKVFDKVFNQDICRLLAMKDMWTHRVLPTSLNYQVLRQQLSESDTNAAISQLATEKANGETNGTHVDPSKSSTDVHPAVGLRDQKALSLIDSFRLFCTR